VRPLPELHHQHLTVAEFGVPAGQLRPWRRRGHLQPSGLDGQGRPLSYGIDILRAKTARRVRR